MKSFKGAFPITLILLATGLYFLNLGLPETGKSNPYEEVLEGTVTEVNESTKENLDQSVQIDQIITIQINDGSIKGDSITVENSDVQGPDAQLYTVGDELMIQKTDAPENGGSTFSISDYVRRPILYLLFGLFLLVVVVVSQKQGLSSFIGMVFSFLVLFKLVLPLLLLGYDPVLTATLGALLIIPVSFYLSHGINPKTNIAIGGTMLTLIFTGLLAKCFIGWSHLSGMTDDAALFLKADTGGTLNFQGLLLAGIMISMLGLLDDVTISQAAVAKQLRDAKPNIRFPELYSRTMDVGKDHIASMVNTLILIYAGSSLPLLLLFMDNAHPFGEVINYAFVAEEIVQTLVGSIGLILAVPITTLLATLIYLPKKK